MKTKIINFVGGPCSGKSTAAAELFAKMKKLGYSCELVTEFIKDNIWDQLGNIKDDQVWLLGNQNHRLQRLIGKVDYVICDSPLTLFLYYGNHNLKGFDDVVKSLYEQYNNIDFRMIRHDLFDSTGRIHTAEESKRIDEQLSIIYKENNYKLIDYESTDKILNLLE